MGKERLQVNCLMEDKLKNLAPKIDTLAEGPSWDAGRERLYWVDIPARRFHYLDWGSGKISTVETGDIMTSLYPDGKGGFMGTTGDSFVRVDPETGSVSTLAKIQIPRKKVRFNDGKCDLYGNYWAGTMDIGEREKVGKLYAMKNQGEVKVLLEGLTISNGLSWDIGKKLFYHIDTPTRKVDVYDYLPGKLEIWNRRTALDFGSLPGNPDGMTIDSRGYLWVAHWGGGCISQWDPDRGERIRTIKIPAKNVTSCAFGGLEMDKLFVTSAKASGNYMDNDMGGSVFVLDEHF